MMHDEGTGELRDYLPALRAMRSEIRRSIPGAAGRTPPVVAGVRFDQGRDRCRVSWPGLGVFHLTKAQVAVIRLLLDAAGSRRREVDQATLIRASGERAVRLAEVFVGSGAWGVLVVPGPSGGHYQAADVEDATPLP